ncbi:MAG TPA: hypothetical protein PLL30_03105 [Candidatus Krumholzibacteria bacterium]|nr:hypothetical protein [Candidatus Krumholzibacteria bacterium]HPD70760.1 hypothetical protein [Candidatus Krumholzibacteria bacterium]HRY39540.1 hypothetical protein [Candidatus Krumholzibacteria bacterium]
MPENLTGADLRLLIQRVFRPGPADRGLLIMVDLPDPHRPDNEGWRTRRRLAADWAAKLAAERTALGLERVTLAWYPNVGGNNADLPGAAVPGDPHWVPDLAEDLAGRPAEPFRDLLARHSLVLAPTELSATAPLKLAARDGGFRAATMPGFLPSMIPALRLDYDEINRRVKLLKDLCDASERCVVVTETSAGLHELVLDLRHRRGHASGGLFLANGVAGNLPSGEAYIVPYEGEIPGDPSLTAGELPVQLGGELALLEISGNRVRDVRGRGRLVDLEREHFAREPAYANLAELGLGVLGDFGLQPTGSILLDEKLGLHIAFGRSDHFGGSVGPSAFSSPSAVVHQDRVYIPETQPLVQVREVRLEGEEDARAIMVDGSYVGVF